MTERVAVFIDGNNLYHSLKAKDWKCWVDIGSLADRLAGQRELVHIYYYNAPPPKHKPYAEAANKYYDQVKKTPDLTFTPSRLQATEKKDEYGTYKTYIEKGADTALSTDLVVGAAEDLYDTAIIVSNDGDYAPVVEKIKERYEKYVEVAYFKGSRPFVMDSVALMRELRKGHLVEYDYHTVSTKDGKRRIKTNHRRNKRK
jgi:uncharacterized LabA/DUF88 family protein